MFSSMFKLLFSIKWKWMGTGMVKIKIGSKKKKPKSNYTLHYKF